MSFPTNEDADPDPTTQMAWPGARNKRNESKQRDRSASVHNSRERAQRTQTSPADATPAVDDDPSKRRLTTMGLFNLSISMAGAQIAWSVELG